MQDSFYCKYCCRSWCDRATC